MGKGKSQPVMIDFETGESVIDQYGEYREIQNKLYQIDNPYVGNKRGILVDIIDAFDKNGVKFSKMIDLFSGSGVVSTFFKMLGKQVISNDLLTSSYYNALVFSENQIALTKAEDFKSIFDPNPNKTTFVKDNYSNRFTPEECDLLDNYRANLEQMLTAMVQCGGWPDSLIEYKRAAYILAIEHYILNRCYLGGRLNKGQVLAELDHRLSHDRNKGDKMAFNLAPLPVFTYEKDMECYAYNLDALAAINQIKIDYPDMELLYADPPYGGAQSDYTEMFAFCEEYIYGKKISDLPHLQTSKKFVTKKDYENNFREVLDACNWVPIWAISYNASSFKDIEGIKNLISDYKKNIQLINIDHEYRYRKDRGAATEYLIIAR